MPIVDKAKWKALIAKFSRFDIGSRERIRANDLFHKFDGPNSISEDALESAMIIAGMIVDEAPKFSLNGEMEYADIMKAQELFGELK